jgi:hypothetical protein
MRWVFNLGNKTRERYLRFYNCWIPKYGMYSFCPLNVWFQTSQHIVVIGVTLVNFGFEYVSCPLEGKELYQSVLQDSVK